MTTQPPLFEIADKTGKEPCGECHLHPGETCDICNATQSKPDQANTTVSDANIAEMLTELDIGSRNFAAFSTNGDIVQTTINHNVLQSILTELSARRATADVTEARIKELEAALAPFADFGEFMELETEGFSDTDRLELVPEESDVRIGDLFVAAFRKARAALQQTPE